jgi:hypothetical protein
MANQFLTQRVAVMTYSAATDAKTGTITPAITASIPINAIITNVIVEGNTLVGAANAEIAITGGGVTLVGAQTLANNAVNGTAITNLLRDGQVRTAEYLPIKASATAPLRVVQSVAALQTGGFTVYVEYLA